MAKPSYLLLAILATPNSVAQEDGACSAQGAAYAACSSENQINVALCNECGLAPVQENPSATCFDFDTLLCSSLDNCQACGPCLSEMRASTICLFEDLVCPGFQCPTSAPVAAPTPQSCENEVASYATCRDREFTPAQAEACFDGCFRPTFPDTNDCQENMDAICPALDTCTMCAPCREELRIFTECVFQNADVNTAQCSNFSCSALPTGTPVASPTQSPVSVLESCREQDTTLNFCLNSEVSIVDGAECTRCFENSFPSQHFGCFSFSEVCDDIERCRSACQECKSEVIEFLDCKAGGFYAGCSLDCATSQTNRELPSDDTSIALIVGIAAGVVVCIAAGVATYFFVRRKQKRATSTTKESPPPAVREDDDDTEANLPADLPAENCSVPRPLRPSPVPVARALVIPSHVDEAAHPKHRSSDNFY